MFQPVVRDLRGARRARRQGGWWCSGASGQALKLSTDGVEFVPQVVTHRRLSLRGRCAHAFLPRRLRSVHDDGHRLPYGPGCALIGRTSLAGFGSRDRAVSPIAGNR